MTGLVFEEQAPVAPSDPNRADIACFVGFVARRGAAVPAELRRWLTDTGWWEGPYARASARVLRDVPVPIDTWETFDRLFDWDRRRLDERGHEGTTYLGAAVRSFFAQGGRKCYVVVMGPPWQLTVARWRRVDHIAQLIPGYPHRIDAVAADRETWSGAGHLFGLPDVSMLCLPDLCDAVGLDGGRPARVEEPPRPEEQFVECSAEEAAVPVDVSRARLFPAPRCDRSAYEDWATAVNLLTRFVRDARPRLEVEVIAALPIPEDGSVIAADFRRFLTDPAHGVLAHRPEARRTGLASAFLQLVYPWARTAGSARLPQGVESPEGIIAGLLARNALTRGAYRSAAALPLADAYDILPAVTREQLSPTAPELRSGTRVFHETFGTGTVVKTKLPGEDVEVAVRFDAGGVKTLRAAALTFTREGYTPSRAFHEHVTVLDMTPQGVRLLSDVTTSQDETYRPASVTRLVSLVIRAARRIGDEATFEPSGERVWADFRDRLSAMLLGLLRAGALRGRSAAEAFLVRCDRSTMTQNDIDNGRVIVDIQFAPTVPVERIRVVLALDEGIQVQLVSPQRDAA